MNELLYIEVCCKKCGGDLLFKYFYLNSLSKYIEYEIITECVKCEDRTNLRLKTNIKGDDEKKK